jgi:hypothetical protein
VQKISMAHQVTRAPRSVSAVFLVRSARPAKPLVPQRVRLDKPVPIAELFGAPIAVVRVRRYGTGREKPDRDEVRQRVAKILHAQTDDIARGILWSEAAFADLLATIEFSDHTKGVLEGSGGHVCFSDHAGTVWYLRTPPDSTK